MLYCKKSILNKTYQSKTYFSIV